MTRSDKVKWFLYWLLLSFWGVGLHGLILGIIYGIGEEVFSPFLSLLYIAEFPGNIYIWLCWNYDFHGLSTMVIVLTSFLWGLMFGAIGMRYWWSTLKLTFRRKINTPDT